MVSVMTSLSILKYFPLFFFAVYHSAVCVSRDVICRHTKIKCVCVVKCAYCITQGEIHVHCDSVTLFVSFEHIHSKIHWLGSDFEKTPKSILLKGNIFFLDQFGKIHSMASAAQAVYFSDRL